MNRTALLIIGTVALILLAATAWAAGSIPPFINYQGRLTNAQGQPLPTADYALAFSIYDSPTGGTLIWGPQLFDGINGQGHGAKVPVVQGYFNVVLGPVDTQSNPVGGRSLVGAMSGDRYLEVTVATNSPILPRQRVLPSALAMNGNPAGTVLAFAGGGSPGAIVPAGYLFCDGRAVSRGQYAELFATIGITFGSGDGATTFNLPDLRGRTVIGSGVGSTTTTDRAVGQAFGEEVHTMVRTELADHTHQTSGNVHPAGADPANGYSGPTYVGNFGAGDLGGRYEYKGAETTTDIRRGTQTPFNVMQPSLVLHYIIKY